MTPTYWLASYPKSGNTWFRIVAANLWTTDDAPIDINAIDSSDSIASARARIDQTCLVETGLLHHDEADQLRPLFYTFAAAKEDTENGRRQPVRLVKTHDAYTRLTDGTPLLGGSAGAAGAILFVRDPRDVACSFAHHLGVSIDVAIAHMADPDYTLANASTRQMPQLRQQLRGWSGFADSWLAQTDIPAHCVRYEDMLADPPATMAAAFRFLGAEPDAARLTRAIAAANIAELQRQESEKGFREAPRKAALFFRRGVAGGWREELNTAQASRIERDHAAMMQKFGYAIDNARMVRRA